MKPAITYSESTGTWTARSRQLAMVVDRDGTVLAFSLDQSAPGYSRYRRALHKALRRAIMQSDAQLATFILYHHTPTRSRT